MRDYPNTQKTTFLIELSMRGHAGTGSHDLPLFVLPHVYAVQELLKQFGEEWLQDQDVDWLDIRQSFIHNPIHYPIGDRDRFCDFLYPPDGLAIRNTFKEIYPEWSLRITPIAVGVASFKLKAI